MQRCTKQGVVRGAEVDFVASTRLGFGDPGGHLWAMAMATWHSR